MGGTSYHYNGDGNRNQQDAFRYILDLQPGLAQYVKQECGFSDIVRLIVQGSTMFSRLIE
jgi:hypothetical protein